MTVCLRWRSTNVPNTMPSAADAALNAPATIALYMAIQLLRHIAVPLAVLGCTVIAALVFAAWRKRLATPRASKG